ncbi:hypothetical protein GCM10027091_70430 [Streptomyces daliensis]
MHGRSDPYECGYSNCSYCGAGVSVEPGEPAPNHQETGTNRQCPGVGSATIG